MLSIPPFNNDLRHPHCALRKGRLGLDGGIECIESELAASLAAVNRPFLMPEPLPDSAAAWEMGQCSNCGEDTSAAELDANKGLCDVCLDLSSQAEVEA